MSTEPSPGLDDQAQTRTTLRVVGVGLLLLALFLFGSGVLDVVSASSDSTGSGPTKFGMLFVGLLLFAPAGWCLQAGFMDARPRGTGAAAAVVTGGSPDAGSGPVHPGAGAPAPVDDVPPPPPGTPVGTGPRCPACGVPSQAGATACDWCGASLAG